MNERILKWIHIHIHTDRQTHTHNIEISKCSKKNIRKTFVINFIASIVLNGFWSENKKHMAYPYGILSDSKLIDERSPFNGHAKLFKSNKPSVARIVEWMCKGTFCDCTTNNYIVSKWKKFMYLLYKMPRVYVCVNAIQFINFLWRPFGSMFHTRYLFDHYVYIIIGT